MVGLLLPCVKPTAQVKEGRRRHLFEKGRLIIHLFHISCSWEVLNQRGVLIQERALIQSNSVIDFFANL